MTDEQNTKKHDQETAVVEQKKQPIAIDLTGGIVPTDYNELLQFAALMHSASLAPKTLDTVPKIAIAMLTAMEIGLPIVSGIQNIAVINNRAGIWGDAALAIVRGSGLLEVFEEWNEGERKTPKWTYYCKLKRKGYKEVTGSFSWQEAIEAGFHDPKQRDGRQDNFSPWRRFTNRMMTFKARNFVLRDQFGDILKGLRTAEDLGDIVEMDYSETGGAYTVADKSAEKMADLKADLKGLEEATKEPGKAEPAMQEDGQGPARSGICAACGQERTLPYQLYNNQKKAYEDCCSGCYDLAVKAAQDPDGKKLEPEKKEEPEEKKKGAFNWESYVDGLIAKRSQFEGTVRNHAQRINDNCPNSQKQRIMDIWANRVKRKSIEGDPACPVKLSVPKQGQEGAEGGEASGQPYLKGIAAFAADIGSHISRLGVETVKNVMSDIGGSEKAEGIKPEDRDAIIKALSEMKGPDEDAGAEEASERVKTFVKTVLENVQEWISDGEILEILEAYEIPTDRNLTLKENLYRVPEDQTETIMQKFSRVIDALM